MDKPNRSREAQRRHRYTVDVWVKRMGVPIVIFIVVLAPLDFDMPMRDLFSWRFLVLIPLAFGIAVLVSYLMGYSAWKAGFVRMEDMED